MPVASPDGQKVLDDRSIEGGGWHSHQFAVPGRYESFCSPHEIMNVEGTPQMIGTVVVDGSDAAGA